MLLEEIDGVFPLRGKMLNVKKASVDQTANNKEITNIKKILGLRNGVVYKDNSKVWPLRYGKIMVMTDQDVDGSHIKGLLFNIFHVMWPSLLKNDFIVSLVTPIMKVTKGKKVKSFYNLSDFEKWKKTIKNSQNWKVKYYKGLGTSTSREAKEYFKEMNVTEYIWNNEECSNSD